MSQELRSFVADELAVRVSPELTAAANMLAERLGGAVVLFYGSVLRTADMDGVLDFYVLTEGMRQTRLRATANRWLWPDVSFEEIVIGSRTIRAKVATMPIDTFHAAARGERTDTTIWARFVQPSALVWQQDEASGARVIDAIADAAVTAGRFAALLGPDRGQPGDFWKALFRQTYTAELRVERPGREEQILEYDPARYDTLLPLAWAAGGIAYSEDGTQLSPTLAPAEFRRLMSAWRNRQRLGKPLNAARLVKAAFTFSGATRYALWKIERHTGISIPPTPWRERHPILAAPGVLWRVWRAAIHK